MPSRPDFLEHEKASISALLIVDALEASHAPGGGLCHLLSRPTPVGRPTRPVPSQPTAAADADRRSGVRRPARTRGSAAVGEEVDRRVRVCESPGRLVGRVWSRGRSFPVLVVWVGSPASGWLVFLIFPGKEENLCRRFFRVRLPIWGPVRVPVGCWHVSSVKYPLVRHVPLSSSSSPWLARDLKSVWRVRTLLVVDYARELGVRGALFSLFAAVACFSCLN